MNAAGTVSGTRTMMNISLANDFVRNLAFERSSASAKAVVTKYLHVDSYGLALKPDIFLFALPALLSPEEPTASTVDCRHGGGLIDEQISFY